ncbi:MAG TPA: DUF3465 domain-containing protein [Gemmatimonadales bacterium]|nr:DUF3465 domain-containing protein [Gemmatimonadales bacterium]
MTNRQLRRVLQGGFALLLAAALYLFRSGTPGPSAAPIPAHATGTTVAEAFRAHRSNVQVEAEGRVTRVLPDDREGSPHERFIVRVEGGMTVLVAHNLELAPRAPVMVGDSITVRGEYEWNDRGGLIHWTHRDPAGQHEAGWIRHGGRLYQ